MGPKAITTIFSLTALGIGLLIGSASAQPLSKNLSLVYDQQTNQYFIGKSSKLLLKEGADSGPVDRIEVSVDGAEFRPYNEGISFNTEGKHSLKFRALNPVNNWSPVQFIQVFVDLTPPTTAAKFSEERYFNDDTGSYLGVNSTIALTSQDNLSGIGNIEWAWVNEGETDESKISFTPYAKPIAAEVPGKRTLMFRGTDRVGNAEAAKVINFFVDNTPPSSLLRIQGETKSIIMDGKTYLSDGAAFAIESSDDVSKVKQTWVEIDGKSQVYIKPIYFLKEGVHKLTYYAVDNVGNKETPKVFTVHTVTSAPKTLVKTKGPVINTGGINFSTKDFQLDLVAQDNVVGLEKVEIKVDQESEFRAYLEPIRFSSLGMHQVSYRAIDRVGNSEPAKSYSIYIHDTPPETTYSTAQPLLVRDGVMYSPSPNIITFNVGTSPVGVKETLVSFNDGAFNRYTGPITFTADHKVQKISYKSIDKLGNEEKPKTLTVNMIGNVPIVDLFISNGKSNEEQVRTNYLDQGVGQTSERKPASKK